MGPGPGHRLAKAERRRLLVAAGACLLLVLALDGWLHLVGPLPGERAIGHWWTHWAPWRAGVDVTSALTFFDALATPWVAAGTVLAAAAIVGQNEGRRWALLVVAASAVVVLSSLLKHAVGPTPLWEELGRSGRNFPSGHVAYATAVFGLLALITWRHAQLVATVVLVLLIPLMAVDRVVAGAHLPSDTIAGGLVGLAWLLGIVAVLGPDDALQRAR